MLSNLLQGVLSGILLGGVYGLISMGLAMIFGVLRIVNFAHGDFVTLAMYLAFFLIVAGHLNPYLTLLITVPGLFVFGFALERTLIRPSVGQPEVNQLVLTAAISLLLQNIVLLAFSPTARSVPNQFASTVIPLGPVFANLAQLIGFVIAVVTTVLLSVGLRRLEAGRALRATVEDPQMAQMLGINTERVQVVAFALGAALTGIAGTVLITYYPVTPTIGLGFLVVAFVSVVMGGMTSLTGTFLSGLVVGVVQQVTASLGASQIQNLTVFVVFILLLLVRPQGLFARRARA